MRTDRTDPPVVRMSPDELATQWPSMTDGARMAAIRAFFPGGCASGVLAMHFLDLRKARDARERRLLIDDIRGYRGGEASEYDEIGEALSQAFE